MMAMLLCGTLIGAGLTLAVSAAAPVHPDLSAGVARLASRGQDPADNSEHSAVQDRIADRLAELLDVARHQADLAITGTSARRFVGEKVGYATLGLIFPLMITSILAISGIAVPVVLPGLVSVGLAIGMSFLPDVELHRRAADARRDMRRTVQVYLELVALERAADAGAVEALERAAAIGSSAGFEHIQDALLRARLEGRTPWQQISELADELSLPELGDVADIMRLSGEDGVAVMPTLRARAASLRASLLQAEVAAANQASERMSIPVALLGVAFMVLLGFPALWRILFG